MSEWLRDFLMDASAPFDWAPEVRRIEAMVNGAPGCCPRCGVPIDDHSTKICPLTYPKAER